jgi:hypothetical protein
LSPDFLIGFFGIQRGLIPLVKATLVGALISNSALIMGLCYISAGLIHGRPRFRRTEAGHHSVLMLLAVAAILFPSAGAIAVCGGPQCVEGSAAAQQVQTLSLGIAAALLVAYAGCVVFAVFGVESGVGSGRRRPRRSRPAPGPPGSQWPCCWFDRAPGPGRGHLTGTVGSVTGAGLDERLRRHRRRRQRREHGRGLRRDQRHHPAPQPPGGEGENSGLDLALGIASASSIQIATFILRWSSWGTCSSIR